MQKSELQLWLDLQPADADSRMVVQRMPPDVWRMALEEMRLDFRTQHWLDEIKGTFELSAKTRLFLERELIVKFIDLPGIRTPYTLKDLVKGHAPDEFTTANILINSSLFTVMRRGNSRARDNFGNLTEARPKFDDKDIACPDGFCVRYSGEQLHMIELLILGALIERSKTKFDVTYTISPAELLKKLGMSAGGCNYRILRNSLFRLSKAHLYFAKRIDGYVPDAGTDWREDPRAYDATTLRLIDRLQWTHGESIRFSIDGRLTHLYANQQYSLLNWGAISLLRSELAQKVFCMLHTQVANMQRHRLVKLQRYAELTAEPKYLHRTVEHAMRSLLEHRLIGGYLLSDPGYGESVSRVLLVWKSKDTPETEICSQLSKKECGKLYLPGNGFGDLDNRSGVRVLSVEAGQVIDDLN